jgi:hypothetical protein
MNDDDGLSEPFRPWPKPAQDHGKASKHLKRTKTLSRGGAKRRRNKMPHEERRSRFKGHGKPKPPKEPTRVKRPRRSPYLHPEWIALRDVVMLRARGGDPAKRPICEHCHRRIARQIHHLVYAPGSGWRKLIVPKECLEAVCVTCHAEYHPHLRPFGPAKGVS